MRWRRAAFGVLVLALAVAGCGDGGSAGSAPTPDPAATLALPSDAPSASAAPVPATDWYTYHRDNARTGAATGFDQVTSVAVGWTADLDGAVYGQPLVVGDLLLAATENDTVYGLAAADGSVRWSAHLGRPVPRSKLPCGNIDPLGITGTMVYDPATRLVFALAETTGGRHTLFGLDIATGAVKVQRVAEPPKGDKLAHQQRSALTLLDGRVYIAYGGLAGDCAQYIGSVVSMPATGNGRIFSYAIPTTREGGIWSPGGASVAAGHLLYAVGNGESAGGTYDGSDSVIALAPGDLRLADRFTPSVWAEDNAADLDLGSMTPAVVGSYVFVAGKRGVGYVLRADRLGNIGGQVAQAQVCPAFGGAAVERDVVYVPCSDGTRAVRVAAGGAIHVLWHSPAGAPGPPVLGGGVWTVDWHSGTLYVLDPATGEVRARTPVGKVPHFASPTLSGGHAYIGTLHGVVQVETG
jgi:outer membrane protein assembly factor BamB